MDPSQMTDEELDAAIDGNLPVEPVTNDGGEPAAPPNNEGQPEEPVDDPAPKEPEAPEDPVESGTEEPVKAPSRREQLRVQALLEKYGQPPTKQEPSKPEVKVPDFHDEIDGPDEVFDALGNKVKGYGDAEYARGTTDALAIADSIRWETRLNIDAPQVEAKYPVLDKSSEEFHPAVADAMSRRYLSMVGFNPSTGMVTNPGLRWKDFVESEFELAEEIATTRTAESTTNIVKQVATTGLRPDGSTATKLNLNKAPEDMTDEELDAAIAQGIPPRDDKGRFMPRS